MQCMPDGSSSSVGCSSAEAMNLYDKTLQEHLLMRAEADLKHPHPGAFAPMHPCMQPVLSQTASDGSGWVALLCTAQK